MNAETISVWAQLIASTGVIISLFYLAAQVRQNTRSSRAIVVDSLARSMHDLAFAMAQNDALLKIVTTTLQDWNSATKLERRFGGLEQRVNANVTRKPISWAFGRRLRATSFNFHLPI